MPLLAKIIAWLFAIGWTAMGLLFFVMGLVDGDEDSILETLGGAFLLALGLICILSLCGVPLC